MMIRNSIALSWLIVMSSSSACSKDAPKSARERVSSGGETSNDSNEGVDEAPDKVDESIKREGEAQGEATGK
ncbi:MAG TPA: hypothetical protein VHZ95_01275 [Polyangiales bacterium]|nr:hypothetical protein [Polyangiales bacterium]